MFLSHDRPCELGHSEATAILADAIAPVALAKVLLDEVQHRFPKPHTDFLEQFVDYQVPPERFDDLAAYDGSVIVERTKGEMSARCDKEGLNFLALNLADQIVTGKMSVEEARKTYGENAMKFLAGEVTPLTAGLQFMPGGDTADADAPLM